MIIEKDAWSIHGYLALIILAVITLVAILSFMQQEIVMTLLFIALGFILSTGITFVQPNQAVIVQFLGKYVGTFRRSGIVMFIPFSKRRKISLRVKAFHSGPISGLSAEAGNPQQITMMLIYKVVDAAKAVFDVENIDEYVDIQSELVLRQLTDQAADLQEAPEELKTDMRERLYIAGIELIEIRLFPLNESSHMKKDVQLGSMMQKLIDCLEAEKVSPKNDSAF